MLLNFAQHINSAGLSIAMSTVVAVVTAIHRDSAKRHVSYAESVLYVTLL
jgi:hypothetical protein